MSKGRIGVVLLVILVVCLFSAILLAPKKENPTLKQAETEVIAAEPTGFVVEPVRSGDGKVALAAVGRKLTDGSVNYTFKTTDREKDVESVLFEKIVGPGVSFTIPLNSWSPDNKQLFVEVKNGADISYLVFKADGSKYGDLDYLNVNEYWEKSKNAYTIRTITGWEGNDLLSVKTVEGPSFWFVVSSRNFLRLRSY